MIEYAGRQQILRGTQGVLSLSVYDGGDLADPASVKLTVTRANGTVLVNDQAASGSGAAARTYSLGPTDCAQLDVLTCAWSGTVGGVGFTITTQAEIVGDLLFNIAELRASDAALVASDARYSDAVIEALRAQLLDQFQSITGRAFVRRYELVTLSGRGSCHLYLVTEEDHWVTDARSVRSIETRAFGTQDWTAFTESELADVLVDRSGKLTREALGMFCKGEQNIRVGYERGMTHPPFDIRQAALRAAKSLLVGSSLPDRATTQSTELGTFILATPGVRGAWFGIPIVDETLSRYGERVGGIH